MVLWFGVWFLAVERDFAWWAYCLIVFGLGICCLLGFIGLLLVCGFKVYCGFILVWAVMTQCYCACGLFVELCLLVLFDWLVVYLLMFVGLFYLFVMYCCFCLFGGVL